MTRNRKPLTAEQQAATEARRARFAELARRLADMTEEQRADTAARMPTIVTIEGRALSVGNAILAAMQRDAVTVVGGFQQWRAAGRQVRKGEHGLMIWAPKTPKADDNKQPGETSSAEERTRFITITMFDVSQTDEATR